LKEHTVILPKRRSKWKRPGVGQSLRKGRELEHLNYQGWEPSSSTQPPELSQGIITLTPLRASAGSWTAATPGRCSTPTPLSRLPASPGEHPQHTTTARPHSLWALRSWCNYETKHSKVIKRQDGFWRIDSIPGLRTNLSLKANYLAILKSKTP